MDQSDVILEALKGKEKEYRDLEEDYHTQKAAFIKAQDEIYERREKLSQIVDEEASKMDAFLRKGQRTYQDGDPFYRSLQQLMEESQFAYQRRNDSLQQEEATLDKNYRKQCNELEEAIDSLRRSYASTNK